MCQPVSPPYSSVILFLILDPFRFYQIQSDPNIRGFHIGDTKNRESSLTFAEPDFSIRVFFINFFT